MRPARYFSIIQLSNAREKSDELQETFVSEFIFDFYDVIEDKRLETEEQEIPAC